MVWSALGIDLGTANTVVCHSRRGIVLDEPSVLIVPSAGRRKPVAVGHEAQELAGRVPPRLVAVRPFQDGVVGDLELAKSYISTTLRRLGARWWKRPKVAAVLCAPAGATPLERRALLEAADEAGMGKVLLMPEPVAGAVGCGLNPMEPRAHMVVDVGGGTAEVAVFSYGGVVAERSSRLAGDEMTLAVYQYLRAQHHIVVDKLEAEDVKIRASTEDSPSLVVKGMDAATGRGRLLTLGVEEVSEAVQPVLDAIVQTLSACLDDMPARAVGDVMDEGILAIGGGSMLIGFDKLIESAFGFAVHPAERPLTCVAEGAARSALSPEILDAYAGK